MTTPPAALAPTAMPIAPTMEIFKDFDILEETYSHRDSVPIKVSILLGKSLPPGPHPVLLNFHGGYLIGGSALYPPFFPPALLGQTARSSAILLSADYTLLPHPLGLAAVHSDLAAFQSWLTTQLPAVLSRLRPSHSADLTRILVNGGSAGGYVAAAYCLNHPSPALRGLSLFYPMLDFDSPWWRRGSRAVGAPNPLGLEDAAFPSVERSRETLAELARPPAVTAAGLERAGLGAAFARNGLFLDIFSPGGALEEDATVWLNRRVAAGERLPMRVWIVHGGADTAVPPDTSVAFAGVLEAQGGEVRLDVVPGKNHGFEGAKGDGWDGVDDRVMLEGQKFLAEKWLAGV